MGIADTPEKTRTLFVVKSDNSTKQNFSDIFSGKYDLTEMKISENCYDYLANHMNEISLVVINTSGEPSPVLKLLKQISKDDKLKSIPVIVIGDDSLAGKEELFLSTGVSAFTTYSAKPSLILLQAANLISLKEAAEVGIVSDIDEITGLYNRQAFFAHADRIINENPDDDFVICISEIDGIKVYNEKNGKAAGDTLLRTIGEYVRSIGDCCLVSGRFAGDQFVVLFRKDENLHNRLLDLNFDDTDTFFSGNTNVEKLRIRCAVYEDIEHGIPVSETCERALLALQTIRGKYGKTIVHYEASVLAEHKKRERIEDSMKEALEQNQFKVFYQPKHDVNTGELTGAEALIRWLHPEFGFMSPGEFIPVFESNGFISEVDNFVWKRTCENLNRWINKGLKVVPISINASKLDFMKPDFFENLHAASTGMNVPPALLHIEVTESLFSDQIDELVKILTMCQKNGYKIELDDFGSGYSSLNMLRSAPVDTLKIDRFFLDEIMSTDRGKIIVEASVRMAKQLGLAVIAEGVETQEQLDFLSSINCDIVQGYYYSRPIPPEDFEVFMEKYR